jgi:hypothetical protein
MKYGPHIVIEKMPGIVCTVAVNVCLMMLVLKWDTS